MFKNISFISVWMIRFKNSYISRKSFILSTFPSWIKRAFSFSGFLRKNSNGSFISFFTKPGRLRPSSAFKIMSFSKRTNSTNSNFEERSNFFSWKFLQIKELIKLLHFNLWITFWHSVSITCFVLLINSNYAYSYNFTYNGITARLDAIGVQNISQDVLTTGCLNGSIPQYSSSDSLWACRGASNDAVLVGNNLGTGYDQPALPNCTDAGGNHLNYTATTNNFTCGTTSSGGGTSGGASGDVQFAAGTAFGGTSGVSWDNAAMRFAPSVSLDMGAVPVSAAAGIKLPLDRIDTTNVSADGQMIWSVSGDVLYIGTGTQAKRFGEMIFTGGSANSTVGSLGCAPQGACVTETTTMEAEVIWPYSGTLSNLSCSTITAPGLGSGWVCQMAVANVGTNMQCNIANALRACTALSSTDTITAGQTLGFRLVEINAAVATGGEQWKFTFVPSGPTDRK